MICDNNCNHTECPYQGQPKSRSCACYAEAQTVASDLAYNAMKNTGELQRKEADRALAEQIKWEAK